MFPSYTSNTIQGERAPVTLLFNGNHDHKRRCSRHNCFKNPASCFHAMNDAMSVSMECALKSAVMEPALPHLTMAYTGQSRARQPSLPSLPCILAHNASHRAGTLLHAPVLRRDQNGRICPLTYFLLIAQPVWAENAGMYSVQHPLHKITLHLMQLLVLRCVQEEEGKLNLRCERSVRISDVWLGWAFLAHMTRIQRTRRRGEGRRWSIQQCYCPANAVQNE